MFIKSVVVGWLGRRILDWGGWLGTFLLVVIGLYNALPATSQAAIGSAIRGDWQDITLGALIPLAGLVVSQVMSFRATVKPQVVTPDGEKVAMKELPKTTQTVVKEQAKTVVEKKRPSPLEALGGLFKRK
jgi:hypothetical protein